jgi:CDP-glycerol glycerophosphotransferase (TagB/SpsB family)
LLWATQCHGLSDEENIKNLESVFGSVQGMTNITLIIKQHPGEGQKHFRLIEKYLRRYNIDGIILPGNSDIYELLYVCDFMITKNSTTADEAIALGKPVIILNLSGIPDIVSHVNHGVALGVYIMADLQPAIEKLLNGAKDLDIYRERYIDEYMYKIDGKANDRICELILRTIQGQDQGPVKV